MAVTLFLIRTPNRPFTYRTMQGRFGELMIVSGPEVTAASLVENGDADDSNTVPLLIGERLRAHA